MSALYYWEIFPAPAGAMASPDWLRTMAVSSTGIVFAAAAHTGWDERAIAAKASDSGLPIAHRSGHVYVSANWLLEVYPQQMAGMEGWIATMAGKAALATAETAITWRTLQELNPRLPEELRTGCVIDGEPLLGIRLVTDSEDLAYAVAIQNGYKGVIRNGVKYVAVSYLQHPRVAAQYDQDIVQDLLHRLSREHPDVFAPVAPAPNNHYKFGVR